MIEKRTDCDSFEAKPYPHSCGDCQTDGHYLCAGCRYIAPFEDMELSDNRERYYSVQELARLVLCQQMEDIAWEKNAEHCALDLLKQQKDNIINLGELWGSGMLLVMNLPIPFYYTVYDYSTAKYKNVSFADAVNKRYEQLKSNL